MRHKAELDAQMLHNQQRIQAATTDLYSTPKAGKSPSITRPSLSPIAEDSISQLLEFSRQQYQAQVDSLRLPPTDLIKFNGDPLQYWKFMRLFTTMVDKESVAAEEKLTCLHQYTEGKAQDAISHCLYNPNPSAGFKEALERLTTRFGNPHTISQAWVEKVLNFKEIRDNVQLRDFADQLRGCQHILSAMKCEEELSGCLCQNCFMMGHSAERQVSNISSVTYALLDPGANTSLVSEELPRKLKVKGKPARLDLDMVGGSQEGIFTRSVNLEVDSLHDGNMYTLNGVRTLNKLNVGLSCLATPDEVAKWDHLADIPIPSVNSDDVHLVIGQDAPRLLRAEEYRVGGDNDPYATRRVLGWAINGPIDYKQSGNKVKAYFLKSDHSLQIQVEMFWKLDNSTQKDNLSVNNYKVIKQWENSVSKDGSHYILDIPFKNKAVALPNNVNLAAHRLRLLERRLTKNADLQMKYVEAMKSTINNGYAEVVPTSLPDRNDGKKEEFWPLQPELGSLPPEAEVKKSSQTYTISSKVTSLPAVDCFIQRYSSWYKLKRAIALILQAKDILLKKTKTKLCAPIMLNDLKRAEISIIDYVQRSQITNPLRVDNLRKLTPIRLSDGLLRFGGRLTDAPIPEAAKHPVILPQKHHHMALPQTNRPFWS
ncbi:hypothetical protein MHYP_G00310460 [Metynnis hypsauchen]